MREKTTCRKISPRAWVRAEAPMESRKSVS
jgi:hypothetical protein